jgi:hypothetical protein
MTQRDTRTCADMLCDEVAGLRTIAAWVTAVCTITTGSALWLPTAEPTLITRKHAMLAQSTPAPNRRQAATSADRRTLAELLRDELARLTRVTNDIGQILDQPQGRLPHPFLETAVSTRQAAKELERLRDQMAAVPTAVGDTN